MVIERFKGWAIPGPRVPGGLEPASDQTLDALSGFFKLFQYRQGHRFSTDDLLVAWYGTQSCPSAHRVLDLGSGIGSVALVAAWRLAGAQFTTIEAQAMSVELARKSVQYNGLQDRFDIRLGDFRGPESLADSELFDLVLGSPPYFPSGTGIQAAHPQKAACRFELRGSILDYARIAAQHLATSGVFAAVFPEAQRDRLDLALRDSGLVALRSRAVILRQGDSPLLRIVAAMRADHLPDHFSQIGIEEPALLIRKRDGSIDPEYSLIKLAIGFPP